MSIHNDRLPLPPNNNNLSNFYVGLNVNQNIANAVGTAVIFNNVKQIDSIYTYNIGTGVLTIPSGWYVIGTNLIFATNAAGARYAILRIVDGVNTKRSLYTGAPALFDFLGGSQLHRIENNGSTVSVNTYQSSGVALNLLGVPETFLSVTRIGDL